jgi:hypothetical protein
MVTHDTRDIGDRIRTISSVRVCTHVVNDLYPYFVHVEKSENRATTKLSDTPSHLFMLGKISSYSSCAAFCRISIASMTSSEHKSNSVSMLDEERHIKLSYSSWCLNDSF